MVFMPVVSEVEINIAPEDVALAIYHGESIPEKIISSIKEAIYRVHTLLQPRIVYRWVAVKGVQGEIVFLETFDERREAHLHVGIHANLMQDAERALVHCVTIGDALDQFVAKLNRSGKLLDAYLMDVVGVVALAKVSEVACNYAEKEAISRDWGVGALLGPGSLKGWSLEDQKELCSLLPLDKIGVSMNEAGVFIPFKSASGMIGIGPGYESKNVTYVCRYCDFAGTCGREKE